MGTLLEKLNEDTINEILDKLITNIYRSTRFEANEALDFLKRYFEFSINIDKLKNIFEDKDLNKSLKIEIIDLLMQYQNEVVVNNLSTLLLNFNKENAEDLEDLGTIKGDDEEGEEVEFHFNNMHSTKNDWDLNEILQGHVSSHQVAKLVEKYLSTKKGEIVFNKRFDLIDLFCDL